MAAGAGALEVELGGAAWYHGELEQRPTLGAGSPPNAGSLRQAVRLLQSGMLSWLAVTGIIALVVEVIAHA
jgi:adenosylcobinamide-phosphate synthase